MDEIRSAYDVLTHASWRQTEIDRAIDEVSESHARLATKQEGFERVWKKVEALMAANPHVEAVEAGNGKVIVRMPSGGLTILTLTPWHVLESPAAEHAQIRLCRNGGGFSSLSAEQLESLAFEHAMADAFAATEEEEDGEA